MAVVVSASDAEIAWAAGIFEGEGCILVSNRVTLDVRMNDGDVLTRFHKIVGGRLHGPYDPPLNSGNRKQFWNWQCGLANDVELILRAFLPWFGIRRAARANEALKALASVSRRSDKLVVGIRYKRGHLLVSHNVYRQSDRGTIECRACRTARR